MIEALIFYFPFIVINKKLKGGARVQPRNALFFFIVTYLLGWLLYILPHEFLVFYVMGMFLLINLFTMFHPIIYHNGVIRPLQLSVASSGLLALFMNNFPLFVFSIILIVILLIIENEDIDAMTNGEKTGLGKEMKRVVATMIMPFSATYVVMILRPNEDFFELAVVATYFAVLFFSSKWFSSIKSFSLFLLTQMILFLYIIETYFMWNSIVITTFFTCTFLFLLISYARKGLLSYSNNNK